jgi:glutamyl-tRNA reductase
MTEVRLVTLLVDPGAACGAFRERIAVAWDAAVADAALSGAAVSSVALRTCLRVEAYLATADPPRCIDRVAQIVFDESVGAPGGSVPGISVLTGREAVAHLFAVAAGLESMIIGERQILRQTRDAWERSRALELLDPTLDRLFQHAVANGKRVRRDTDIGGEGGSVTEAAADLVAAGVAELRQATVMIVGAGNVARAVAIALGRRGVRAFAVVNRSHDGAAALAAELMRRGWTCSVAPWEHRGHTAAVADVIVCATASPGQVLSVDDLAGTRARVVVDLAAPPDVDARAVSLAGAKLIDLDAVWQLAPRRRACSPAGLAEARSIMEAGVDAYMRWLAERQAVPAIAELMRRRPRAGTNPHLRRLFHDQTIALKRGVAETAG